MESGDSQKLNVLVLAYVYPPDNYAGAARPHRLVKYLRRRGHRFDVLAASPDPEERDSADDAIRVRGEFDHVTDRSRWFYIEKLFRNTVFPHDEGATWVWNCLREIKRRRRLKDPVGFPDAIFSTAPPFTTHLLALLLKRRYNVPWIADFRDPLLGNTYRSQHAKRVDRWLEPLLFRNLDAAIANTDAAAGMLRERYPHLAEKIHVIWNGFDSEQATQAQPIPSRPFRVLSHVGSLYGDRYPKLVIDALGNLIQSGVIDPGAILVQLVGPASVARPDDAGKPWLEFRDGHIPRKEAHQIASEADYLLLMDNMRQREGEPAGLQVPGKLFEYICIGRPVLACTLPGSPVERILEGSGVPHALLHPGSPMEENARKLKAFLQLPTSATPASEWFHSQFSAGAQAEQLEKIIQRVVSAPKRR